MGGTMLLYVLQLAHLSQVLGVDAVAATAGMVDLTSLGDRAEALLEYVSVRVDRFPFRLVLVTYNRVAVWLQSRPVEQCLGWYAVTHRSSGSR